MARFAGPAAFSFSRRGRVDRATAEVDRESAQQPPHRRWLLTDRRYIDPPPLARPARQQPSPAPSAIFLKPSQAFAILRPALCRRGRQAVRKIVHPIRHEKPPADKRTTCGESTRLRSMSRDSSGQCLRPRLAGSGLHDLVQRRDQPPRQAFDVKTQGRSRIETSGRQTFEHDGAES